MLTLRNAYGPHVHLPLIIRINVIQVCTIGYKSASNIDLAFISIVLTLGTKITWFILWYNKINTNKKGESFWVTLSAFLIVEKRLVLRILESQSQY